MRQETLRMGRASFERVVRRGMARGELPGDIDVHLVVDLARAPIIYRRVVAQTPVRASDIAPIVDAVLAAFAPPRPDLSAATAGRPPRRARSSSRPGP
jgi:hypothetical protein